MTWFVEQRNKSQQIKTQSSIAEIKPVERRTTYSVKQQNESQQIKAQSSTCVVM